MNTTRKTLVGALAAATLLGAAAPAFAEYYWDGYAYRYYRPAPVVVAPAPSYYGPGYYSYYDSPRTYYYDSPRYYDDRYYYRNDSAASTAAGAIAGAVIGGSIAGREDRAAGAAVGALIGGAIGNSAGSGPRY